MNENLTIDIKETMRDNARNLAEIMILEDQPFRLILWNNDNWDKPLPENIMKSFEHQIVLDIKEMTLEESFIDEATGEIVLVSSFGGEEYSKVLEYDEIIAILDLQGQPYMINNFPQDGPEELPDEIEYIREVTTKEDWLDMAVEGGIPREAAEKSMNAFIQNNDWIKEQISKNDKNED
jgi:hypothetical protein